MVENQRLIGKKIKIARIYADLTQEELAQKLNFGKQVVKRMESGNRKIDISELKKISEITGKSIDFFYEEESKIKSDKYIDVSDLDNKEIEIIKATIDKIRELKKERTA